MTKLTGRVKCQGAETNPNHTDNEVDLAKGYKSGPIYGHQSLFMPLISLTSVMHVRQLPIGQQAQSSSYTRAYFC